jgi:tripartite ATP-independent transporter DctM subunit
MILLFSALLLLMLIGMPVYAALGISSLVYILVHDIHPLIAAQQIFDGINRFPLLAIPFFILAGNLMNAGAITERVFAFARSLVGWVRGGLGHVNILASLFFSGMSGAAIADAGGLGTVEIKAMRENGYDSRFAVGVTAASSTIGPIIPPSISMVIYGVTANVSIGQLFVAGVVPGVMMALALHAMVAYYAWRRGYPKDHAFSPAEAWRVFKGSLPALIMPGILLGGIFSGVFTATEAAVVAAIYAAFIGIVVYRSLTLREIWRVLLETFETTAVVLLIVGAATLFGWIIIRENVGIWLTQSLLSLVGTREGVLLIFLLILLLAGLFLETTAAILVFTPIMLPVLDAFDISRIQFGVIMVLTLMIGLMTPPVGLLLFVVTRISGLSFAETVRACMPFLVPLFIVLLLITVFPVLTLGLPGLLYAR